MAYQAGTWTIDAVHSTVGFTVKHMMVSKVRGKFNEFEGTIVTAENPADSTAEATIKLASIDTGNEQRDGHLRTADFFDTEKNSDMTWKSTSITGSGDEWEATGDLTLNGVTKPVTLKLELEGFGPDAYGGTRAGFTATGTINRKEFGVNFNALLEGGGAVVSDKVDLTLEIEAVLNA